MKFSLKPAHEMTSKVTLGRRQLLELLVTAYHEGRDNTPEGVLRDALTDGLENRRVENPRIIDDDSLIGLVAVLAGL